MIKYIENKLSLEEYIFLRNSANWDLEEKGISKERIQKSLERSPLIITAYDKNKVVGMIRISGDLEMYGYIQDTIVLEEYQGKGIGKKMLEKIIKKVEGKKGYLLGVCPSKVSVKFYERFGFKKRQENPNGFMSMEF